jgi:hypothetical protein
MVTLSSNYVFIQIKLDSQFAGGRGVWGVKSIEDVLRPRNLKVPGLIPPWVGNTDLYCESRLDKHLWAELAVLLLNS